MSIHYPPPSLHFPYCHRCSAELSLILKIHTHLLKCHHANAGSQSTYSKIDAEYLKWAGGTMKSDSELFQTSIWRRKVLLKY